MKIMNDLKVPHYSLLNENNEPPKGTAILKENNECPRGVTVLNENDEYSKGPP